MTLLQQNLNLCDRVKFTSQIPGDVIQDDCISAFYLYLCLSSKFSKQQNKNEMLLLELESGQLNCYNSSSD